jgi:hypothetical protein
MSDRFPRATDHVQKPLNNCLSEIKHIRMDQTANKKMGAPIKVANFATQKIEKKIDLLTILC